MIIKDIFKQLFSSYTSDHYLVEKLWNEIETSYSNNKRYYHTLSHLDYLIQQLANFKERVIDWDIILFSVFYHDIVYNVLQNNNEEQSASLAEKRLNSIGVSVDKINKCEEQILATKTHEDTNDYDTNLFTDADLSILGQAWNMYENYTHQLRKEYAVYPDLLYNEGRKKVLMHFLEMNRIFKTDEFYNQFEKQARENLKRELKELKMHLN